MLTVSQPNATSVQEAREFLAVQVGIHYPEVRKLKLKKKKKRFSIRAKFKNRRIKAFAYDLGRAITYFFEDLNRKVYMEI